jgi:hypothetical protein
MEDKMEFFEKKLANQLSEATATINTIKTETTETCDKAV